MAQVVQVAVDAGFKMETLAPNPLNRQEMIPSPILAGATAYAESKLDPAVVSPDGGVGLWQVDLQEHPQYTLVQLQDPRQNARAALTISGGGRTWSEPSRNGAPWYAIKDRPQDFALGIKMAKDAVIAILNGTATTGIDPSRLGTVNPEDNILESAAGGIGKLMDGVARTSASWFLGALGWVGKLFYTEVVHPQWERTQRATVHYYNSMTKPEGYLQLMTTIAFWSVGYAILWRDVDDIGHRKPDVEKTALAQTLGRVQQANSQRKLYTPKEAKKETAKKPKPKPSTARVAEVRKATVERKRTVKVGWDKEKGPKVETESETKERTPVDATS